MRSWWGAWWAAHWAPESGLSLGLHVDWHRRHTSREGIPYGPYVDLHVGPGIVSIGRNPIYSTELAASTYRAGLRDADH